MAIENEIAGTTRDQIAAKVKNDDLDFVLVDTGGIGGGSSDKDLEEDVSRQSVLALASADLIVFTINGREEMTSSDEEVISILRKRRKTHVPVILAITKCDSRHLIAEREGEYAALDIAGDTVFVSASQNLGVDDLSEIIIKRLKELHFTKEEDAPLETGSAPRIAFVGIPNVGKSSLFNLLTEQVNPINPSFIPFN